MRVRGLLFLSSAVLAASASAQVNNFSLISNGWVYTETNIFGHPADGQAGLGDFINPAGIDNMYQNWWWFATPFTGREFALSKQVGFNADPSGVRVVYLEDGGPNSPNSLLFDLQYTLTALPDNETAVVQIAWKVHNLATFSQSVRFFSYTDYDLNGTSGGDTGEFIAPNQFILTDANPNVEAGLIASVSQLSGWEQDFFPATLNKLNDGVLDVLNNATTPLGPGDLTNAFSWDFTLAGNGARDGSDQMVGSLVKYVHNPVPEPATLACLGLGAIALASQRRRR